MGVMQNSRLKMIIFPFFPSMVNFVERWLSKKAANGWRLEDVRGWKFSFRKCKPYTAIFFSYSGFGTSMGISHDYLMSKRLYSRAKSALNKSNAIVYEVDIRKIDSDFKYFVMTRNKFYLKHYVGLLLFALVFAALTFGWVMMNSVLSVFLVCSILFLVYSLASVVILSHEVKRQKTGDG